MDAMTRRSKEKEMTMAEVEKPSSSSKVDVAVRLLEEKLGREYGLSQEELRKATITIKNGEVTVKGVK